jgi:RHS repeat-associated protein
MNLPSTLCGNPIESRSGNKSQSDLDYESTGPHPLRFARTYNSADERVAALGPGWRTSSTPRLTREYSLQRKPIYDPNAVGKKNSNTYLQRSDACVLGWNGIKSNLGLSSTTAKYENGGCNVYRVATDPSTRLYSLPVWDTVPGSETELVGYKAERADGRIIRFGPNGLPADGVQARIQVLADGVRLTENDAVEDYDASGRLLSIRQRDGYQQTYSYASADQLSLIIDSFGRSLHFGYDGGRLVSLTDPSGQSITYTYDDEGRLSTVSWPDATARTYHYEDPVFPSALTGLTDENQRRYATWTYDTRGRAKSSEHAGGADKVTLVYNTNGTTTVTDALGSVRTYQFNNAPDGAGRVTSMSAPCARCGIDATSYTYDPNGFLASKTDFNGTLTTYIHNARGLEESRNEALGTPQARTITTQWHPTYRLPTQIDEPGRRTTLTYDSAGNRLTRTITDTATGESRTTSYTYTGAGLLASIDGPRTDVADVTHFDYDSKGNRIRITNALGHVTQIPEHDAHGNPLRIIDPNGAETVLSYDLRQRLKTRSVAGATTRFEYDGVGQLTRVTIPDGSFIAYSYDAAHRLTGFGDNLGNRVRYTLDAMGNHTQEDVHDPSDSLRKTHTQIFDALGRLRALHGTHGQLTQFDYDAQGNRTAQTDAGVYSTLYQYDALQRLKHASDAAAGETGYAYDALDHLVGITDPKRLSTDYVYNAFGDLLEQTSPDTGLTRYTYDAAGNPKTRTDARGINVTYTYDTLNRLTAVDYPGTAEDVSYHYDGGNTLPVAYGIGRLTGIIEAGGQTSYVYDARGNLTQTQRRNGTLLTTASYAYDLADRLIGQTYPSGRTLNYERDSAGRISRITTRASALDAIVVVADSFAYLPFGPAVSYRLGNGLTVSRPRDTDGRLEGLAAGSAQQLSLGYDTRDNLIARPDSLDAGRSETFGYDALSRLQAAQGPYGPQSYGYDGVGNRTADANTSYSYPVDSHRLSDTSAGMTLSYDAAGNVTRKGDLTFTYDTAGRLSQATRAGTQLGRYTYNAFNQRSAKTAGGRTLQFHYGLQGELLAETDALGASIREYVYLEGAPLALIAQRIQSASPLSPLPGQPGLPANPLTGTPEVFYVHTDQIGTPHRLTDHNQVIAWDAQVDPFGKATLLTALVEQPLRFPGQYYDQETGLHQNWHRDYDPALGRYLQSDPIGLLAGINTYSYVENNPLTLIDPEGLDAYRCRRTLGNKPGEGTLYGRATQHWYSCVVEDDGASSCGGQTMTGSALGSPGRPTTPEEDYYHPEACGLTEKDNDCFDSCLKDEWQKPRPQYAVVWGRGTHCQEYDNDVNSRCRKQCALK